VATKKQLVTALASVPIFEGLSMRHLRRVAGVAEVADYMEGASVVRQGDEGDSFFVVLTGEAKVTVNGRTVNRVVPGDHFGEISLLDGGARTASVVSETPMTLLMIDRRSFAKLLEREPSISVTLLQSLSRALRRVDRSIAR
jgi:CRP/FNR family transcriptional regulator, cyclic AMP receptor protein